MKAHLDETLAEAKARLGAQWTQDVADYDEVEAHILGMADMLTAGIDAQMPAKVNATE